MTWFWLVLGVFWGGLVLFGWLVDRHDRQAAEGTERSNRDPRSMWDDEVREHRRDMRAARQVRWFATDVSWTRHSRRGR